MTVAASDTGYIPFCWSARSTLKSERRTEALRKAFLESATAIPQPTLLKGAERQVSSAAYAAADESAFVTQNDDLTN